MKLRKLLLILSLTSLLILSGVEGCQSTPQQVVYKTTASLIDTVDASMKLWASWIVHQHTLAGVDAQKQADLNHKENIVREAYQKYQDVLKTVVLSALAATTTTPGQTIPTDAILNAATSLLKTISDFTK